MSTAVRDRTSDVADRNLRVVAGVFLVALLVHAADHFRRGLDVVTPYVFAAGNVQLVAAAATIVLILRGHRFGPPAAVVVGFASAVGFTAAHILPHWSALSDSFTGRHPAPGVTGFSWFAALFEIAADLALACCALVVLSRRRSVAP